MERRVTIQPISVEAYSGCPRVHTTLGWVCSDSSGSLTFEGHWYSVQFKRIQLPWVGRLITSLCETEPYRTDGASSFYRCHERWSATVEILTYTAVADASMGASDCVSHRIVFRILDRREEPLTDKVSTTGTVWVSTSPYGPYLCTPSDPVDVSPEDWEDLED